MTYLEQLLIMLYVLAVFLLFLILDKKKRERRIAESYVRAAMELGDLLAGIPLTNEIDCKNLEFPSLENLNKIYKEMYEKVDPEELKEFLERSARILQGYPAEVVITAMFIQLMGVLVMIKQYK